MSQTKHLITQKIIAAQLNKNGTFSITMNGNSMDPYIINGAKVTIVNSPQPPKIGDVISIRSKNQLITHRIIKFKTIDKITYFLLKGDHNHIPDGWFSQSDIIGYISSFQNPNCPTVNLLTFSSKVKNRLIGYCLSLKHYYQRLL